MPLKAVRSQISLSAVHLIVQASRLQDGSRRMVSITEITGMEGEVISMQEVFRYQRLGLDTRRQNYRAIHRNWCAVSNLFRAFPACGVTTCRPQIFEPVGS